MTAKTHFKRLNDPLLVRTDSLTEAVRLASSTYTVSIKRACKILKCDRSWVNRYVRPFVHYIYISNAGTRLMEEKENVWMNTAEFEALIRKGLSDPSRQTILIPVEMLVKKAEEQRFSERYEEMAKALDQADPEHRKALLDKMELSIRDHLSEEGRLLLKDRPLPYKRRTTGSVPCPLDVDIYRLVTVSDLMDYGDSNEEVYREVFSRGMMKVFLRLPDAEGNLSEKVYYVRAADDFGARNDHRKVLVKYDRFLEFREKIAN